MKLRYLILKITQNIKSIIEDIFEWYDYNEINTKENSIWKNICIIMARIGMFIFIFFIWVPIGWLIIVIIGGLILAMLGVPIGKL
jgi:hypothetical protein